MYGWDGFGDGVGFCGVMKWAMGKVRWLGCGWVCRCGIYGIWDGVGGCGDSFGMWGGLVWGWLCWLPVGVNVVLCIPRCNVLTT